MAPSAFFAAALNVSVRHITVYQTDARRPTSARRQKSGDDRTRAWDGKRTGATSDQCDNCVAVSSIIKGHPKRAV